LPWYIACCLIYFQDAKAFFAQNSNTRDFSSNIEYFYAHRFLQVGFPFLKGYQSTVIAIVLMQFHFYCILNARPMEPLASWWLLVLRGFSSLLPGYCILSAGALYFGKVY